MHTAKKQVWKSQKHEDESLEQIVGNHNCWESIEKQGGQKQKTSMSI